MKPKTVRNALLVAMVVWGAVFVLEVFGGRVHVLTVIAFLGSAFGMGMAWQAAKR